MDTIFTVTNEELNSLNPEGAVDFFRELIWAEATSLGIGINNIDVPSAIYDPDGGVDAEAEVKCKNMKEGRGILKPGINCYQIKTGNYNINRKERVRSCLENNGRFVIVLFGWDKPNITDDKIVKK